MDTPPFRAGVVGRRKHARPADLHDAALFETRDHVRFADYRDFASFLEDTAAWADMEPTFRLYYPSGHDIMGVFSIEDIFRISGKDLRFLLISTHAGQIKLDYRRRPSIQVFPARGQEKAVEAWVRILQQHLQPVPRPTRWTRYPLVPRRY